MNINTEVSENRYKESLISSNDNNRNVVVLKWINLIPISLPYVLKQKLLFLQKIDLWKTELH